MAYEAAELVVVPSMHERKAVMFREADAFVVMPGGVGTLEEAIELLSWARLNLHVKPMVFLNANEFWSPLFDLIDHTIREGFNPAAVPQGVRRGRAARTRSCPP
ncbi:MAG: LOG family protein [Caulobacteraceae bacterium]